MSHSLAESQSLRSIWKLLGASRMLLPAHPDTRPTCMRKQADRLLNAISCRHALLKCICVCNAATICTTETRQRRCLVPGSHQHIRMSNQPWLLVSVRVACMQPSLTAGNKCQRTRPDHELSSGYPKALYGLASCGDLPIRCYTESSVQSADSIIAVKA